MCRASVIYWFAVAILSSASAFNTRPPRLPGLLRRDSTTCTSVDPKLPSTFTCPTGSNCVSLDSSSSALCCPESSSCNNIQPISCDLSAQNATAHPSAGIFTSRLGDSLPTCGSNCCPFGYDCITDGSGNSVCSIIQSTSIVGKTDTSSGTASSSSSSSSSSPATRTATSTSLSATSSSTSSAVAASATVTPQCNKFPIGVFLAGFFPGIFIGAFLMLGWVICSGRHRKPSSRSSTGSSVYKPHISDPITYG